MNNARDAQERQLAQISLFEKERKQRRMNLVKDIQSDLYVDVEIANNDDNRWSYSQPAEAVSSPVHSRLEELKNKLLEIDSRKNTPTNAYVSSSEKVSSSKTASLSSCNSAKRVSEKRSAAPVSPAHHRLEELKQRLLGSEAKFASSSHSICEDDGIENRTESRKRTTDESLRSILKNSDTQRVTRSSYATVAESSRSMNSLAARSEGNIYPQLDFSQDGQLDASPFTRKELSASGEGIRGSRAKRYSSDAKIASQEPPLETTSNINTRDFSINHSQTLSGENFGEEVNHSREGVDDDDDDVIYEIYSDIGRLTGRLENSMRSSRSSLVSGLESKITNCSFSLASEDREYDNSLDRISSIKK